MAFDQLLLLIADNISRFCYIFTIFFNSALIILTAKYTKQIVGTYRNMIVTFATFGIIFSTADILVRPLFHSYNGCFMYFTLGSAFRFSKRVTEISLLVYAGVYGVILAFLTIQFLYRASLLSKSRDEYTKYFDGWRLLIWIFYTFCIAIMWGSSLIFLWPSDVTDNYLRSVVRINYGVEISHVPYFPVLAYSGDGENKAIMWNSVYFLSIVTTIMTFHYTVMIFCGLYMYRKTKLNLKNSSTAYEKLQKQFFHALIYQTCAPTLFFHFPVFVVLFAPFFDLKFNFNSSFVVYGFSAYPLVDSLIVLNVVTEYKNAYRRFVKQLLNGCIEIFGEETPRQEYTRTNAYTSHG